MIDLLMEAKKQALIAQLSELASQSNEDNLKYELSIFFQKLKEKVLHELHEYWKDDTILLEGHLDLILAPIFESQQQYYNIIRKYNIKEYRLGTKQGRRLVRIARKPLSSFKSESQTIKVNKLLNIDVNKDELFATNDWSQQRLLNQNFTASERTMNRVDQDINKIISDGYKSGVGVNKVAANIENRFNQLQSWESERIARTEMHNAHQMGIMNTYHEMGVEYTQWTSAHDSRVRGLKPKDKANHVKMDGEIIPLGGTFSNDLQYPGDTNGPLYEWINCRCGNVPFIMPDGYMAPPGMAQFKEADLVQTLDYWNQDELITQAITESEMAHDVEILTDEQIRENLSGLSNKEKLKQLGEVLDSGQRRNYTQLMYELKQTPTFHRRYKEIQSEMFEYEKLIYRVDKPVPQIDINAYALDNQDVKEAHSIVDTILEKKQIMIQEKVIFPSNEFNSVRAYGGQNHIKINGYVRQNSDWNYYVSTRLTEGATKEEIIAEVETLISDIDSAMARSPGLAQDTRLFRACDTFESTLKEGDISSFKGYGSCSFQEESAIGFDEDDRYMLNILAPKGQKGIAMNATNNGKKITHFTHEHEYLLPKNQKFQVLNVDHKKRTATILLID